MGRRLLVCPPWAAPGTKSAGKGRLPLIIEPGQGFGTGNHPSTALALEMLGFFSDDVDEGVAAVREKRKPNFPSAQD